MNTKTIERFSKKTKINTENGCVEWTDALTRGGYGRFKYQNKSLRSHRVSYEIHYGLIPEGLHILHRCDNRKCVNPDHLFLGTHQDNMSDKADKNRQSKSKDHAFLTLMLVFMVLHMKNNKEYNNGSKY